MGSAGAVPAHVSPRGQLPVLCRLERPVPGADRGHDDRQLRAWARSSTPVAAEPAPTGAFRRVQPGYARGLQVPGVSRRHCHFDDARDRAARVVARGASDPAARTLILHVRVSPLSDRPVPRLRTNPVPNRLPALPRLFPDTDFWTEQAVSV